MRSSCRSTSGPPRRDPGASGRIPSPEGQCDSRELLRSRAFRRAFGFYIDLYRDGLAPPVSNTEIANIYQEFARGYFACTSPVRGTWASSGAGFRRICKDPGRPRPSRVPTRMGAPDLAGGRVEPGSLPRLTAQGSGLAADRVPLAAGPAGSLLSPERGSPRAPGGLGRLRTRPDPNVRSFGEQLERVVSTPKIPEWEQIATRLQERVEMAVRGAMPPDSALAALDRDVDRILEKRRWLLARDRRRGAAATEGVPMRNPIAEQRVARRLGSSLRPALGSDRRLLLPAGARRSPAQPDRFRHLLRSALPATARFVGLRNYLQVLANPEFWTALKNTLYFVLVGGPSRSSSSRSARRCC